MKRRGRHGQRGQVMILAVMVMAFLFVPLAVYVIDSALVEINYVQLGETLQGAAEDGASSVDVQAYRQRGAVQIDPDQAKQVADRSLRVSQLPGLQDWTISVSGNTVTITANVQVHLLVVGTIALQETKSASFAYGA